MVNGGGVINRNIKKLSRGFLRCSKDFTYSWSWICSVETSKPGGINTMSSQFDVALSCNFDTKTRETDSAKPIILKRKTHYKTFVVLFTFIPLTISSKTPTFWNTKSCILIWDEQIMDWQSNREINNKNLNIAWFKSRVKSVLLAGSSY